MKNFKLAVMAGILASCLGSSVYADTFTLEGEVLTSSLLTFSGTDLVMSNATTVLSAGDHALTNMIIDNNDPDGFTVSIHSQKGSKLVRHDGSAYYSDAVTGNVVGYTVTFTPGSGTLGATDSETFASSAKTLTTSAVGYDFTAPTQATVDKTYAVKLTVADVTHLLHSGDDSDTYRDMITITLADL